jgi:hypothetical protein
VLVVEFGQDRYGCTHLGFVIVRLVSISSDGGVVDAGDRVFTVTAVGSMETTSGHAGLLAVSL